MNTNNNCQNFSVEQKEVKLGFMPLVDCAPLIVALEQGYFKNQGLEVTLVKQYSWATMRDKLHAGVLDAAQLLAPMVLASSLGIGGEKHQVIAPMVLSQNGNGITISMGLYEEIKSANKLSHIDIPLSAELLKPIIKARKKNGKKLTFATVYPHSCHYYQLCSWFEYNNIAREEIDILIITPVNMVEALRSRDIDGFCVGSPWNAKAVRDGVGVTCVTSCDVWPNIPEKVLGMLGAWHRRNPETTKALIYALQQACNWLGNISNRFEAARILSQYKYLDLPLSVIAPSLIGSCLVHHQQSPRTVVAYNQFSIEGTDCFNKPQNFQAQWLLSQMVKVGQIKSSTAFSSAVEQIFRKDIYQQAFQKVAIKLDVQEASTELQTMALK